TLSNVVKVGGISPKIDIESGDVIANLIGRTDTEVITGTRADPLRWPFPSPDHAALNLVLATNNPWVPGSPDIDIEGVLIVDPTRRVIAFIGLVDEFPAYEAYASFDSDPAVFLLFQQSVLPGKTPWNLVGHPTLSPLPSFVIF